MTEDSQSFSPCLSVVVPAYNEEATLETVVHKLLQLPQLLEVVIVDDCSSDRTGEVATKLVNEDYRVSYLRHPHNRGKTQALKTGFAATHGEIVIVQDADLEYDPTEIPLVIQPIVGGYADVCFGSRFMVRKATRVLYYYHFVANKFLTTLSNIFTNLNMSDVETGYKAFRGEIIRNMIITSSGFNLFTKLGASFRQLPELKRNLGQPLLRVPDEASYG